MCDVVWARQGFVYYQAIKRELNRRPMYKYRCDERLKDKAEGSTRLNLNMPSSSNLLSDAGMIFLANVW